MIDPDRELQLIKATQRDPQAFGPLYEAYADLVWRYCLSRLGSPERAADATSQTFVKALAALPAFTPQRRGDATTFRAWLMLIARNVVIDEARKHRPGTPFDDDIVQHQLVDADPSPEEHAVASDEMRVVRQALATLPPQHQRIVELRALGTSVKDIAAETGLSVSAIKSIHYRAHRRLRELLAQDPAFHAEEDAS